MIDEAQDLVLGEIHANRDYFTQEGVLEFSLKNEEIDYTKRDFLYRGGTWRGRRADSLLGSRPTARVLAIGHSAYVTGLKEVLAIKALTKYERIYAIHFGGFNDETAAMGARLLPLGLTNPTQESDLHVVYGDSSILPHAYKSTTRPSRPMDLTRIYSNFTVSTSKKSRKSLFNSLPDIPHILHGIIDRTLAGRARYLSEIRESGLVLCPGGKGPDSHRLYETLYKGALPVVLKNSYQFQLCRHFGFPAVGLDKWRQVADIGLIKELASEERFSDAGLTALMMSSWVGQEGLLLRRD
jgi:hypothetical protein